MKTALRFASLALVAALAVPALRAAPAAPVSVVFDHPEKFVDVRDTWSDHDNERGIERYLPPLREHLEKVAARRLPAGQQLTITFTDLDLAGDFEPWRGINFHDIRIVKDLYPPRVDLEFKLIDADGKVVSEGKRQLRDLGYLTSMAMPTSDPLRYDKEMLNDWLRQEFKRKA